MWERDSKAIAVVVGVGAAQGTGAAVAREFCRSLGYRVALVARHSNGLNALKSSIHDIGGEADAFQIGAYTQSELAHVFDEIAKVWPDGHFRVGIWNASQWSNIPFLDIKDQDIRASTQINIEAPLFFAQLLIPRLLAAPSPGGSLLITGATSATRGSAGFAAFAAGKSGLRAMSQSIAREFGQKGVHVAFVVLDGMIPTPPVRKLFGKTPEGAARLDDPGATLSEDAIAKAYLFLHQQSPGAWTLEMDLRPAKEKF